MTDLTHRSREPTSSAAPDGEPTRPYGTLAGRASLFVVGTGLAFVGARAASLPLPPCPLRGATGFPCPFCGFTHAGHSLLTGQIVEVARVDPAALVFAALVGVAVVAQLVAVARRSQGPALLTSRATWVVVAVVLAAHWATTIVTGGMLET